MQKTGKLSGYTVSCLVGLICLASMQAPAVALEYSQDNHTFEFGSRGRLANVDANTHSKAASLLLRLHVESEWSSHFSTLLEVDHVELGWKDEFSNGVHFNGNPVIPDAQGSDLNQVLIRYAPANTWQLTLGREAVNLGNQRFVGTNGFWQNQQTLDTLGFKYEFGVASHVLYRYVDNVNRINGDHAGKYLSPSDSNFVEQNGIRPASFLGDHDHNTHLVFAQFKEWDYSQIQVYYFDMDIKEAAALSNQTLGARYQFKGRWHTLRTQAHGEIALQTRTEINNNRTLSFYDIGAGVGYHSHEVSLNYQHLGASNGASFVTPLASLHEKNGWVDKFLLTPSTGLRDYSLQYIWRSSPFKLDARYHAFYSDRHNTAIGEELDMDLIFKFNRENSLLFRYAEFKTRTDSRPNEQRLFLMFTHNL
ncbi:hypothetical protein NBRC116188_24010 [Oceaniserpentilla sp. 4NH20-0058]